MRLRLKSLLGRARVGERKSSWEKLMTYEIFVLSPSEIELSQRDVTSSSHSLVTC